MRQGLRVAIGGASHGIGAACARLLVTQGARLLVCARNSAEVDALASGLRSAGAEVHAIAADLATDDGARAFARAAHEALGGVDLGLVCAGGGHVKTPLSDATRALLVDQLLQNAVAPGLAAAALLRAWDEADAASPGGSARASRGLTIGPDRHVLVLSSLVTRRPPIPGTGPYAAGKAALEELVRGLAEESWPRARVNALCLGAVATRQHRLAGTPADEIATFPSADEIAPLVLKACGPRTAGWSGRCIDADALAADPDAALHGDGRLALVDLLQPPPSTDLPPPPEAEPGRRPSPRVRAALRASASGLQRYPEGAAELARRLAALHGVPADAVVLSGGGATELLERSLRALCARGDEVVTPFPSYELLPALCAREALRHRPVPAQRDADGLFGPIRAAPLLASVGPRTRAVYLASPDNPSGAELSAEEEKLLCDGLGPAVTLLVDEAWSLNPLAPAAGASRGGVVRLRSFSKLFGLAGLRVGFALAPPALAALLRRLQLPFPLGAPQLVAASAALDELPRLRRAAMLLARERERTAAAVRSLGLAVSPGQSPVLLIREPRARRNAGPLLFALRAAEVPVQEAHWDSSALVLGLGSRAQNRRAVEALARAVST